LSRIIGVFDSHENAEKAVNEVRNKNISSEKISIVAKEDSVGDNNQDEGFNATEMSTGATTGGTIGGIAGLLAGAGALTIPGLGPILAAGPIAAGLSGVAAGGLTGSLVDAGVPKERGEDYENEVKSGAILALVDTNNRTDDVEQIFRDNGARKVEKH